MVIDTDVNVKYISGSLRRHKNSLNVFHSVRKGYYSDSAYNTTQSPTQFSQIICTVCIVPYDRHGGYSKYAHSFCDVNLVDDGYAAKHGYHDNRHRGNNYAHRGHNGNSYGSHGNSYGHHDFGYGHHGNNRGHHGNSYRGRGNGIFF